MLFALRRVPVAVLLTGLLLAGLALAGMVRGGGRAEASHTPGTHVGVVSNLRLFASNGYLNLPEFSGQGDGVIGAQCSGAAPLGGPTAPAQVITNLRADLTYLRVLNAQGTPLNGQVVINCTLYTNTAVAAARLERWGAANRIRF